MTIGERIKASRKGKGLSQKELGKVLGVSGAMIGQYETGQRKPRLDTLQRIAAALGVEWTELVPEGQQGQTVIDDITEKLKNVGPFKRISPEEAYRLGILKSQPTPIERINRDVSQMTQAGQEKVADYAADILPRYKRPAAPQSPPAPQKGTDTTQAPDAPETPPEGE